MPQTTSMAILFADVSGSTRLYERLGDTHARTLISKYIELLVRATTVRDGRLVKTIGDEVMCVFPTADKAAESSLLMQDEVKALALTEPHPLSIRIGFHFGQVIEEDGDVFGDAVNVAARMAGEAKAGQIITSGDTRAAFTNPAHLEATRFLLSTTVKGKREPIEIHELTWGEDELTEMAMRAMDSDLIPASLAGCKLSCGTQQFVVNADNDAMTMGRGLQSTFVVPSSKASRVHAKVEWRRGRFFLVDQSTNGTYLRDANGRTAFVHRDELQIQGAGLIGLGQEVSADSSDAVKYAITEG